MLQQNSELVWVCEPNDWNSTLRAGDEDIGFMRFEGSLERATAEIEGRKLTLEHHDSALHPRVTVRAEGDSEPSAIFDYRITGGGTVSFRNGVRYHWHPTCAGSRTWCFKREGEKVLVCVSEDPPNIRGSKVRVCEEAAAQPETPVLLLLGWFLQVQIYERFLHSLVVW